MAGPVPSKVMQTPILPFCFDPIFMKDAHSAQSNEKCISDFYVFFFLELWLIVFLTKSINSWT